MNTWTKRSLLVAAAAVLSPAVVYGAGTLLCGVGPLYRGRESAAHLLTSLYPSAGGIRYLGKAYLKEQGTTAAAALHRLEQHAHIGRAVEAGCPAEIFQAVEEACRADFKAGNVCSIDGWVLARTELDVAALSFV